MRLDNVRLLVSNFAECRKFYVEVLGLEPRGEEIYCSLAFPSGEAYIALFEQKFMAEVVGIGQLPASRGQDTAAVIIEVDELDGLVASLKAKGVTFVTQPEDRQEWGIRTAHLRDPDGNLIELYKSL